MAFKGVFQHKPFCDSIISEQSPPIHSSEAMAPGKHRKPCLELVKLKLCGNFYILLK